MARLKTIGCLLALTFLASAGFAAAPRPASPVVNKLVPIPPVGPSPITPDCRYLFVVDTSAAMQRYADGLHRTTHRLVVTGLGGRMQEGDVFTVWTYADTVLTREFPLNAWTPDLNIALANRAYEFLAQQKFRGKSNLRPVFAELGQALAIATNLTIVLISDGTDVIVGTPFDRPINVTYGKRASEMRSTKMPFVTALVTQRGEFTHWAVRGGLEDIGLPMPEIIAAPAPLLVQTPAVVPPAPTPPPPAVPAPKVVVPTNAPTSVVTAPTPKPSALTPPATVSTNLVASKPPEVAAPKTTPPPPTTLPTPAPKPQTNTIATLAPAPKPTPPTPKPSEPVPIVTTAKKPEPATPPTATPAKPDATASLPALPLPVPSPKPETKVTSSPSPKPVIETPKPPAPAPQPVVSKPKEVLVTPAIPPVIPPALRQPKSVVDASNALAKVELLRPPAGTSAPPAKPLEARVIETKPALPKPTNTTVVATKPAPPVPTAATNPPAVKPATNTTATATTKPKNIPILVPTNAPPRLFTTKSPAPKVAVTKAATNAPPRITNAPAAVTAPAVPAPKLAQPETKKVPPVPETKASAVAPQPTKPVGQLAVASPAARKGGWAYLAAAVALLVVAGSIIAHLLRPRPNPSVISQSLDDKRV